MYKTGIVTEAKPGFCRVQLADVDIITDWLPIAYHGTTTYKDHHPYQVNQQVACVMDDQLDDGCIVGAIYNSEGAIYNSEDTPSTQANKHTWLKEFADGTTISYNSQTKLLKVDATGKIVLQAETETTSKSTVKTTVEAPIIELKGNVTVVGSLTAGSLALVAAGGANGKVNGNIEILGNV
ncbi:MAG: phage baseplate assembly protein V, partial [Candidatus Kapaibacterium sp.]